jgi:hypothetical protein
MTRLTKVVPRESKCMGLGACGAAVLRPYEEFGERLGLGRVKSKSRDLGNDRGYRMANG